VVAKFETVSNGIEFHHRKFFDILQNFV